ncbi:hypothetical protein D3Z55_11335 [Clostridiaceae bacterium]|nr:hypothetical protein [Clostridiaceae bacterium]
MFCYEIPQFEKKRLLRTEMLEQLRDYPRDYLEILYSDYSDGILCGCTPGWVQDKLTIKPGILRYKEKLYFLKEPFSMTCVAQDKVLYLKVQFHAPVSENGIMTGKTRIYLDEIPPASADEMELCRFRLQEGARLRDSYENFADCLTEFDTIHLIDVLWASPEKATLHPKILRQYAMEILRNDNRDAVDASFAVEILSNRGILPEEAVRAYINIQTGSSAGKGNKGLYDGLAKILKNGGMDRSVQKKADGTMRRVMLL